MLGWIRMIMIFKKILILIQKKNMNATVVELFVWGTLINLGFWQIRKS